jgi:adenosylmethionine-8-amino-7-oxononanoate aminotransferase
MVKELKKKLNLSDSIIAVIDESLKRRNYLTHNFFRTHNFEIFSEEGRKIMIAELKEIQEKLDKAHQMMSAISSLMIQIAGHGDLDMNRVIEMQKRGKKVSI